MLFSLRRALRGPGILCPQRRFPGLILLPVVAEEEAGGGSRQELTEEKEQELLISGSFAQGLSFQFRFLNLVVK